MGTKRGDWVLASFRTFLTRNDAEAFATTLRKQHPGTRVRVIWAHTTYVIQRFNERTAK